MIKPMLAASAAGYEDIRYPAYMSVKFDGIRAYVSGGKFMSRTGKAFPNPYLLRFASKLPDGIDVELIASNVSTYDNYTTHSFVMSHSVGAPKHFWIVAHDIIRPSMKAHERMELLKDCGRISTKVHVARQHLVLNTEMAENKHWEIMREHEDQGKPLEGMMFRHIDGMYKLGRSTLREGYLVKLKEWREEECTIQGWSYGHGMFYRSCGTIEVVRNNGIRCNVGTGKFLTDKMRDSIAEGKSPIIGKKALVKYRDITNTGRFFHPILEDVF